MRRIILIAGAAAGLLLVAVGIVSGVEARQEAAWQARLQELRDSAPAVIPLEGPFTVALQPGHWKIDEAPAEIHRRPRSFGAEYAGVRELDINLAVVDRLVPLLEAEGWHVIVVPATVPPGLRADAFISVHADWGADVRRSGWKLAPPYRPSEASSRLAGSLRDAFAAQEELSEDVGGITVGMRGYFGFAYNRYRHASSPYTPATLVELGFVTNAADRVRMSTAPEYYARILHQGLRNFRFSSGRPSAQALIPRSFRTMYAGPEGAQVFLAPDADSAAIRELGPGEAVMPIDSAGEWYEVRMRNPNLFGWVAAAELRGGGTS